MYVKTNLQKSDHEKTRIQAMREVFLEFCSNSTIHGVRYFAERSHHWSERIWWLIAFCLSVSFCAFSIRTMLIKWYDSPVVLGLTENEMTVGGIAYPSVTICAETKAKSEKIDVFATYHAIREKVKLSAINQTRMEALFHMCEFFGIDYNQFENKFTDESIYETIQNIAPTFNETLAECYWQFIAYNACEIFTPILTDEGVCFTFNALNSRDIYTDEMAPEMMIVKNNPDVSNWSMEKGYTSGVRANDYPIRVFNAKKHAALMVHPGLFKKDSEYLCRLDGEGFKVILSAPGEAMRMTRRTFHITPYEQVEILIKPTLTYTSEALRKYPPNKRKCFFASERKLRYYKNYAQHSCVEECLANFTQIECGCAKFSMPRAKSTKICGAASVECYTMAAWKLYGEDVTDGLKDENSKLFRENCNCLPACATVFYDAEVDRAKFDGDAVANSYKVKKTKGWQPARITIRFKDYNVVTLERSERYTYTHFLSICGGLLGLFLGVSALSIVEFFYYTTLRLFWTIRLWKSRNVVAPNNVNAISCISVDSIDSDDKKHGHENGQNLT